MTCLVVAIIFSIPGSLESRLSAARSRWLPLLSVLFYCSSKREEWWRWEKTAAERKIQRVWSDGTPALGPEEMRWQMSTTFCSAFKGFFQGNTILFVTWTFGIRICSYLGGSQRSRGVERYPPGLQEKETILEYISRKVNILEFLRPFKGVFKSVHSDSPSPPRRAFPNHPSCKGFERFISKEIQSRILTGAVKVWARWV